MNHESYLNSYTCIKIYNVIYILGDFVTNPVTLPTTPPTTTTNRNLTSNLLRIIIYKKNDNPTNIRIILVETVFSIFLFYNFHSICILLHNRIIELVMTKYPLNHINIIIILRFSD